MSSRIIMKNRRKELPMYTHKYNPKRIKRKKRKNK